MLTSRQTHKYDRVTVTFVPSADDKSYRNVPSTFSAAQGVYQWRKAEALSYLIVPKRVSHARIEVDVFIDHGKRGKLQSKNVQRAVQEIVRGKIESEWKGLKLGTVSRPTSGTPPQRALVRGSIEDILGVPIES
ncbi:MAG: hypothetical protein AB1428_12600 [Bacteroidota bacterium]